MDVWKEKQADSIIQISWAEKDLEELKVRKQQLFDAFLYKKNIDKTDFDAQDNKLKEEITLVEIKLHELKLQDLDVETVQGFSQHIILNSPSYGLRPIWNGSSDCKRPCFLRGLLFGW